MSSKMAPTTSSSIPSMSSRPHSLLPSSTKASPPAKKTPKESKSEKSLETTVEKLTQNRNKEISAKSDVAGIKNADKVETKESEKEKRVGEGKEEEGGVEKPLERVNESETKKSLDQKDGDAISSVPNSDSPTPVAVNSSSSSESLLARSQGITASPPVDKSRLEASSEGAKPDEASATKLGGTDVSGSEEKLPCTDRDRDKGETSGSSTVTTNNSNNSKPSEGVVEARDK